MNSLDRMSATWICEDSPQCDGMVENWTYWNLIHQGSPVCPICGEDMECCVQSGKIDLTDGTVVI